MASADQFLAGPGPSARPRASWMLWLCQKSGIGLLREAKRHYKQRLTSRAAYLPFYRNDVANNNEDHETNNNRYKKRSKKWSGPGERAPKKTKTIVSVGKIKARIVCQTSKIGSKKGFQLVTHPPYSPDLTLCNIFLFPNIKNSWKEENFHQMKRLSTI
ncbi:hypothetical protein LAZ67_3002190 [Cordylochernes scorpioides]|uniref:Transposase n=1 Tax=Cordylochernes scorpioides TaxID=51811 RepID=A0ABY6K7N3_9ARAC|nr:hypothetical protein LAZ67_3002190 [Cordylochernes scorpioides]